MVNRVEKQVLKKVPMIKKVTKMKPKRILRKIPEDVAKKVVVEECSGDTCDKPTCSSSVDKKSDSNDEQNFVSMVDSDGETHWYNCLTEVI